MTPQEAGRLAAKLARGYFKDVRELMDDVTIATGVKFKHGDRMTAEEAKAVIAWGESEPWVVAAITDKNHDWHDRLVDYQTLTYGFAYDYPMDAQGAPAAPTDTAVAPIGRVDTMLAMFRALTPEQAAAHLAWAREQPEFAAFNDPNDPQHGVYRDQVAMLQEIARGVPLEKSAYYLPPGNAIPILHRRHEEFGGGTGEARAAQERLTAAYRMLTESAETPVATSAAAAPPAKTIPTLTASESRQAQIAKLYADPRYMDRNHPENKIVRAEMRELYRAEYPDPTPVTHLPGDVVGSQPSISLPEAAPANSPVPVKTE